MKTERKTFSGVMNLDDGNDIIPQTHHKEARNVVFRGNGASKELQSVVGNRLITNSLPAGTNSCIGAFYDQQDKRLFYFNYNSNSNHGIYIYNTIAKTISTLFLSNTDSATDILGFTLLNPITSINMVYGDTYASGTDTGGDTLFWIDSLKRPSKLNVDRKLANKYALYNRSYLDVAKAPPVMPIQCTYENDVAITTNNLKDSLFQFIYRWVYDDGDKSVWSTGSKVPLPYLPFDQDVSADPTKNSRINLYYSTGDETVRYIELAVRRTSDGVTSDYEFITSINKADLGGSPNNTVSSYLFYNNTTLIPIDVSELSLLFDYVPLEANAQELLNGNALIYGGIKEGYANPTLVATASAANSSDYYEIPGALFFSQQNGLTSEGGTNTIKVYLTGAGTNTSGVPTAISQIQGAVFYIKLKVVSTDYTILYNNTSFTSISSVLSGLSTNAISQGFTTSISGNVLTITASSEIHLYTTYTTKSDLSTILQSSAVSSELYNSAYRYGVVYYDDKGRTNGVVTTTGLRVNTGSYPTLSYAIPQTTITINSTAPSWAKTYSIVRTKNLSYDKNIFWVSDRAFYNDATYADSSNQYQIAYVGIGNMVFYNEYIQSTSGYISYDYSPGDRIKFINRFDSDGLTPLTPFAAGKDFEIIGVDNDPNINGTIAKGTFIKIKYPTNFIDANLKFFKVFETSVGGFSSDDYQNYHIQIYSNRKQSEPNEVYYEVGQKYGILSSGYHVGGINTQTSSTSATTVVTNGQYFYKNRKVPIGSRYIFSGGPYTQNNGSGSGLQFSTVVINVWNPDNTTKTISTSNYQIASQVVPSSTCNLVATNYPNSATADAIFRNISASPITIRIKGTLPVSTITNLNQYVVMHAKIVTGSSARIQTIIPRANVGTTNDLYEIKFDANIVVDANSKLFLMTECQAQSSNSLLVGAFQMELDVMTSTNITIIEDSFSDVYKLKANSNSRPLAFDKNAAQVYYPTLVRYSMPKVAGTQVNELNRFYYQNSDEYDRQRGDIRRLKVRGGQLKVFQDRGCGAVGVLEHMLFNTDGSSNLIQTNKIINQIHYYLGDYGMGWCDSSLTSSSNADYFVDPVRGYQVRLSNDGFTPISETCKAQYAGTTLATKYASPTGGTLGGYAKILGAYDFYEEEYVAVFQGFYGWINTTIAFNEKENRYSTFYDYAPEWLTSAEGTMISFRSGGLYLHDNTTNYANFYGTQYKPSIKLIFNDFPTTKKRYNTITMLGNKTWVPDTNGDITTNLGQTSSLQFADFISKDDKIHAAFKRDTSSTGGLYNGNVLKGSWAQINLKPVNGNEFVNLYYIELSILEPFYNR